jgi:tetratricopeptide (TPR) repeat protein
MTEPGQNLSTRKRILFRAILLFSSLVLLAVVELALRLFGFGGYPPIFRKVGQTGHGELIITDQAGAVSFFFANRERPGYNDQYSFYQPKTSNAFRVFIVGESAAKGFPQPRNLAASAFLDAMLCDAWPDRQIEVINLGTTAVASYPVLEMMTRALDYQPDLVVIYTGHNEFFGTYGVASVGRAGSKPWMLPATRAFHSLALTQTLEKLARRPADTNITLMERMVSRSYVAPEGWQRAAAANNLHHNVREMLARCRDRGVTALVCTQPANERDLAPIGTDKLEQLDDAKRNEFAVLLEKGAAWSGSNPAAAAAALTNALALAPRHARATFLLAQALAAAGRNAEALPLFRRARDLDTMPWRATSAANEAILRAAREFNQPVCDLETVFETNSPGGAIGWELMDDHVHPTLRGQALIAETIVENMMRLKGRAQIAPDARARIADWQKYARRLGENRYDRYGVAHSIRVIFDAAFMRENNPSAFDRFNQICTDIESQETADVIEALHEWQTYRPHAGGKRPITALVGRVRMRQRDYTNALALYEIAQRAVPRYTSWHLEYVYYSLACKEKLKGALTPVEKQLALEAIEEGQVLLLHGFSETGFTERHMARLHQLRGEFAEAIPLLHAARRKLNGVDLVAADQALIVSYLKTGEFDEATKLAQFGADKSGQFAPMYRNMLEELRAMQATNAPVPIDQGRTLTR